MARPFLPLGASIALLVAFSSLVRSSDAYDPLDPTGNITIKWDVMRWTADGYVQKVMAFITFPQLQCWALVCLLNLQTVGMDFKQDCASAEKFHSEGPRSRVHLRTCKACETYKIHFTGSKEINSSPQKTGRKDCIKFFLFAGLEQQARLS